jgi:hypothetical protein
MPSAVRLREDYSAEETADIRLTICGASTGVAKEGRSLDGDGEC